MCIMGKNKLEFNDNNKNELKMKKYFIYNFLVIYHCIIFLFFN